MKPSLSNGAYLVREASHRLWCGVKCEVPEMMTRIAKWWLERQRRREIKQLLSWVPDPAPPYWVPVRGPEGISAIEVRRPRWGGRVLHYDNPLPTTGVMSGIVEGGPLPSYSRLHETD